ncbi:MULTISPECIES: aminotransferase class IV [unclassified Desulfovibrio]|uniref:aminotransferase class IV n=1 Tax=unclassified Desulfovibrio TaxID=2593640 RepID=UPI0013EACAE8|nr:MULTISPECIES: aminotransferase class IV [unclassified Desulfovibrio]
MEASDREEYLEALLAAPRPGAEKVLAFYDWRVGRISTDGRLLFVPLDDHLCHRGDGLFESICCRGRRVFALEAHLARLREGAAALAITPPCSWEELRERILDVARAGGRDHCDVRVFLSRGPGGFGISPAECPVAGLYIVALASRLPTEEYYLKGLTAFTSAIPPKQEYLARIKNTNYLPNVFMAAEAREKGMDVAVTFDEEGHMGEAAIANIGIVDAEGRLRSPEIRRILPGTTLLAALRLAAERMPVVEGPIHRDEIARAREMLLFTSATLCVAVTHFDGRPVGEGETRGRPGPVALWLKDALLAHMLATGTPY